MVETKHSVDLVLSHLKRYGSIETTTPSNRFVAKLDPKGLSWGIGQLNFYRPGSSRKSGTSGMATDSEILSYLSQDDIEIRILGR